MSYFILFTGLLIVGLFSANTAKAVPPPDFIFNVGRQVVQMFTFLVLGLSIGFTFLKNFFQTNPFYLKYQKWLWIIAGILVIAISYFVANWYGSYSQNQEYQKWLQQSNKTTAAVEAESVLASPNPTLAITTPTIVTATTSTPSFFEINSSTPKSISNEEFKLLSNNIYVLDAREDEEYENGHYPGSHHIRFADVVDGGYINLPKDQTIYVFCWSGIRGKETVDFLKSKNILARYLEMGADGWVSFGGIWDGAIKFRSVYTDQKYKTVFSTAEVKNYAANGAILVDSRPKDTFDKKHIPGSINIPIIYTPSNKLNQALDQIPTGSLVISVCDDFVSCFDATIIGVKFEKRGVTFLGRYNKPWDY